jgi:hypothetical protein
VHTHNFSAVVHVLCTVMWVLRPSAAENGAYFYTPESSSPYIRDSWYVVCGRHPRLSFVSIVILMLSAAEWINHRFCVYFIPVTLTGNLL